MRGLSADTGSFHALFGCYSHLQVLSSEPLRVNFHPACLLTIGDALAFCNALTANPSAAPHTEDLSSALQWPASGGDASTLPGQSLPGLDGTRGPGSVDPAVVAQLLSERRRNAALSGGVPLRADDSMYPGTTPMAGTPGPAASLPRWASEAGPWGVPGLGRGNFRMQREAPPSMEEQMAMDGLITSRVPQR
jgi:hypothetical protein